MIDTAINAEQNLITVIVSYEDCLCKVIGKLCPEHFASKICREIYSFCKEKYDKGEPYGIDILSQEVKGAEWVQLIKNTEDNFSPLSTNIEVYADSIINQFHLRECRRLAETICKTKEDTIIFNSAAEICKLYDSYGHGVSSYTVYEHTTIEKYMPTFLKMIQEGKENHCVSTGFQLLDKELDGGLYSGLYVIGGVSSVGKTTFTLQIADYVASMGQDTIIFSLEMATSEIVSKSVSRLTYELSGGDEKGEAATIRQIMAGYAHNSYSNEKRRLISEAIDQYTNSSGVHLRIIEGVGSIDVHEIKKGIEQHIKFTGIAPVVIIDYLQIIAPCDKRATDKRNIDETILELKRMSRDFKIPIVVISALNRDNYAAPISMAAFKESGGIEYGADVLIGLQLTGLKIEKGKVTNLDELKSQPCREMEAVILKNRNGRTGGRIPFQYRPRFNVFNERELDTSGWGKRIS